MPRFWCFSRARRNRQPAAGPRKHRLSGGVLKPTCWYRAGLDTASPRRPGRVPRRSGRSRRRRPGATPRCAKPRGDRHRRQPATPAVHPGADVHTRRPASMSCRCSHTRRIPGRWPSSTNRNGSRGARVPLRAFINPENRMMVYRRATFAPLCRAGVPAQRDAGVGLHRPGDLGDARRARAGPSHGTPTTSANSTTRWRSSGTGRGTAKLN